MIFTNSVRTSAFGYIHVLPVVLVIFYLLPKERKSKHNISKANQKIQNASCCMEITDNLGPSSVTHTFSTFFAYTTVTRPAETMGFYGSTSFEKIFRHLCNGNGGKKLSRKL